MASFTQSFASLKRHRTLWIGGTLLYTLTAAGSYLYFQRLQSEANSLQAQHPEIQSVTSLSRDTTTLIYNTLARDYDKKVYWDEWMMGLLLLRRWMIRKAEGHVLEIAAGTGRNLPYYVPERVQTLTFLDTSEAMLAELHCKQKSAVVPSRSVLGAAETLPFGPACFDTVVSTFSLCAVEDPCAALFETLRVLRPGGHARLLEHGCARYGWLNTYMRRASPVRAHRWGCFFDRDLDAVLNALRAQCAAAGVHVAIDVRRFHLGTTWIITITKLATVPIEDRGEGEAGCVRSVV